MEDFNISSVHIISTSSPTSNGDFWYDTRNDELNLKSDGGWVRVVGGVDSSGFISLKSYVDGSYHSETDHFEKEGGLFEI